MFPAVYWIPPCCSIDWFLAGRLSLSKQPKTTTKGGALSATGSVEVTK